MQSNITSNPAWKDDVADFRKDMGYGNVIASDQHLHSEVKSKYARRPEQI